MGKYILILQILASFFFNPNCHAQTSVKVSEPRIELDGNTIHIYYDILHTDPTDRFNVSIEITDENGNHIDARAFNGDIGKSIHGGNNRHITWDLDVDKIYLNAQIYFEINATLVSQPEPEITQQIEILGEDEPAKGIPTSVESKSFNRTGLIIQSIALPGLGLSRYTRKPHWIRGMAGYGCIAGSIIFYQQARNTYNSLEDYQDFDNKKDLYETSIRQDNISEVFAYAAIGIWVTDFLWTLIVTSDLSRKSLALNKKGVFFSSGLDPMTFTPTLNIRYSF